MTVRDPLAIAKALAASEGMTFDDAMTMRRENHARQRARGVPMKTCPTCQATNYLGARICSLCFVEIPKVGR